MSGRCNSRLTGTAVQDTQKADMAAPAADEIGSVRSREALEYCCLQGENPWQKFRILHLDRMC